MSDIQVRFLKACQSDDCMVVEELLNDDRCDIKAIGVLALSIAVSSRSSKVCELLMLDERLDRAGFIEHLYGESNE